MNAHDTSPVLTSKQHVIVFASAKADCCAFLFLLYHLLMADQDARFKLMVVVAQYPNNKRTVDMLARFWKTVIRTEQRVPANIDAYFYRGDVVDEKYPGEGYGLTSRTSLESGAVAVNWPNWNPFVPRIMASVPCFIFSLKPPTELLAIRRDRATDLAKFSAHTCMWYGSYVLRHLYARKLATPAEVRELLHMCGKNYVYEAFMAVGNDNTISAAANSLGTRNWGDLPYDLKMMMVAWNKNVIKDCLERLRAQVRSSGDIDLLASDAFDTAKVNLGYELSNEAKENCAIIKRLFLLESRQFMNADTGVLMSILIPEHYRRAEYGFDEQAQCTTPHYGAVDEGMHPLYVYNAGDRKEEVRLEQISLIKTAIQSYGYGV